MQTVGSLIGYLRSKDLELEVQIIQEVDGESVHSPIQWMNFQTKPVWDTETGDELEKSVIVLGITPKSGEDRDYGVEPASDLDPDDELEAEVELEDDEEEETLAQKPKSYFEEEYYEDDEEDSDDEWEKTT